MAQTKSGSLCCVVGCVNNRLNSPGTHFYRFPAKLHLRDQRLRWIAAVNRVKPDGSPWQPSISNLICSRHFIDNKKSLHPRSPSYVPSIFPKDCNQPNRSDASRENAKKRLSTKTKESTNTNGQMDEYAKGGRTRTQPVAFVNVNVDLDEENIAAGIPPLVPTTSPIILRNPQVSQLPQRDKTSVVQRPRNSAQTFIKQIRNLTPERGSSNQHSGQQKLKTLVLKTIPLKVKEVAQTAQGVPQAMIPQQTNEVCLRWDSYHSNMQNSFPSLLDAEHFVDVTLACEGRSLKCHKIILSSCSDYLAELLRENPCQHPIILMKDLKFWEVEALVKFMYRGEVNVAHEKLPQLLNAAEALQVKGLACSSQKSRPPLLIPQAKPAAQSVPVRVVSETKKNKPSTSSGSATAPSCPKRGQKRRTSEATESRPFTKIRLQRPTSPGSPNVTVKLESLDIPSSPTEMFSDKNLMTLHQEEDRSSSVRDSEDQDLHFCNMDGPPDLTDGEDQDQMEFVPTDSLEQEQDTVEDLEADSSADERDKSRKLYKSEGCEDDEIDEETTREAVAYKEIEKRPTGKLKESEKR